MNHCSKPGCTQTGAVVLAYDYAQRKALLHDPVPGQMSPHLYALCMSCAEKLRPPKGWTLEDERVSPPLFAETAKPRHLDMIEPRAEREIPEPQPARRQLFFGAG